MAQAGRRVGVSRATAFRAVALPQDTMLGTCRGITKLTSIMKKYVFEIKRGGAGDSQKLLTVSLTGYQFPVPFAG